MRSYVFPLLSFIIIFSVDDFPDSGTYHLKLNQ